MLRIFHDGVYMMYGCADLDQLGFGFVLRTCLSPWDLGGFFIINIVRSAVVCWFELSPNPRLSRVFSVS